MRLGFPSLMLLAACAREPEVVDYEGTCEVAGDCVAVVDEGACGQCSWWSALSEDGAEAFVDDQERYFENHECRLTILLYCPLPETPPDVSCDAGVCVVL